MLARGVETLPPYLVDKSLSGGMGSSSHIFKTASIPSTRESSVELPPSSSPSRLEQTFPSKTLVDHRSEKHIVEGGNGRGLNFVDVWLLPFDESSTSVFTPTKIGDQGVPSVAKREHMNTYSYLSRSNAVSQLCMMMGYLLHRSREGSWCSNTRLRLLALVDLEEERLWMEAQLQALIKELRMEKHFRAVRVLLADGSGAQGDGRGDQDTTDGVEDEYFLKRKDRSENLSQTGLYNLVIQQHLTQGHLLGAPTVLTILPIPAPPPKHDSASSWGQEEETPLSSPKAGGMWSPREVEAKADMRLGSSSSSSSSSTPHSAFFHGEEDDAVETTLLELDPEDILAGKAAAIDTARQPPSSNFHYRTSEDTTPSHTNVSRPKEGALAYLEELHELTQGLEAVIMVHASIQSTTSDL